MQFLDEHIVVLSKIEEKVGVKVGLQSKDRDKSGCLKIEPDEWYSILQCDYECNLLREKKHPFHSHNHLQSQCMFCSVPSISVTPLLPVMPRNVFSFTQRHEAAVQNAFLSSVWFQFPVPVHIPPTSAKLKMLLEEDREAL